MDKRGSQPASADRVSAVNVPETETTVHLLERARQGDPQALERLLARHLAPLQRWAKGRLPRWARDLADTEDLVQDALLNTLRRIDEFDPRGVGALHAYLRQAVINRVRDELRRKGHRPEMAGLDDAGFDTAQSPLEQAIGRESLARYERALAKLREEEREAIIGRIEMGYTYEELAEVLGKPTSEAARKAAQRALVRLTMEMEQDASE